VQEKRTKSGRSRIRGLEARKVQNTGQEVGIIYRRTGCRIGAYIIVGRCRIRGLEAGRIGGTRIRGWEDVGYESGRV
jgi:hypothetical protein